MILDGHYTHASDVWSFAVLAWELYKSLACGQKNQTCSIPYFQLQDVEVNLKVSVFHKKCVTFLKK